MRRLGPGLLSPHWLVPLIGISLLGLPTLIHGADSPAPSDLVEKLQERYQEITDLTARFDQKSTNASLGITQEAAGRLLLKRPGRMRWEYATPEVRFFITNGTTLWVYTPGDSQVIVQPMAAMTSPLPLAFLAGRGDLRRDFEVTGTQLAETTGLSSHILSLTPKTPDPAVARMALEVDPTTLLIRKVSLFDTYSNSTIITLHAIQVNTHILDTLFSFIPPPGVKTISPSTPRP